MALALLTTLAAGVAQAQSSPDAIDQRTLVTKLQSQGFHSPPGFKAVVVRLDVQTSQVTATWFDWRGTARDRTDWWPASTIKLYAAIAALERLNHWGFPTESVIAFHDHNPLARIRADRLVRQAIKESSNAAFDRLLELVGFDQLNGEFLAASRGFEASTILRGYSDHGRDPNTGVRSARPSPRITIREGARRRTIPARQGQGQYPCPREGNCTTLRDLAESMRRLMLHEKLTSAARYRLRPADLRLLRQALSTARHYRIAQLVEDAFAPASVEVWHKPGFARRWVSDVLFIKPARVGPCWVLAMAARGGRRSLDDAATHLGRLLAAGSLGRRGS